jgi:hypothetical protein
VPDVIDSTVGNLAETPSLPRNEGKKIETGTIWYYQFLLSATLFLAVVLDRFFFPPNYSLVFPPFIFVFCISIKSFISSFFRNTVSLSNIPSFL